MKMTGRKSWISDNSCCNHRDQAQFEEERLERERRVSALMEEKRDLEAQKQNAAREIDQFANAVNSARERNYSLQ